MLPDSHHSLVTPIEWKPMNGDLSDEHTIDCHHSLVTPIEWKLNRGGCNSHRKGGGHHSLVTPIDWKQGRMAGAVGDGAAHQSPLVGDTY